MSELEAPISRPERRARQRSLPLPEMKFVPAGNPSLPTFVGLMLIERLVMHEAALLGERDPFVIAVAGAARIAAELGRLARDPERRARMARAAVSLGKPDAALSVAKDLLDLVRARSAAREAS